MRKTITMLAMLAAPILMAQHPPTSPAAHPTPASRGTTVEPRDAPQLVACYTFNSDLSDSYGQNDFTAQGAAATYAAGKVGNAVTFATSPLSWASLAVPASGLEGSNAFSVIGWVKPGATNTLTQTVIARTRGAGAATDADWAVFLPNARASVLLSMNNPLTAVSAPRAFTVNTGTWYFFAARYTDQSFNLTTDTTVSSTAFTSRTDRAAEYVVLNSRVDGTFNGNSSLDELRIYRGYVSDATVTALYNSGNGVACP